MIYTLDYCIRSALANAQEIDLRSYQKYLKWAIDGFRRLNLAGLMPTVSTIRLDIEPNTRTATLPIDYVDYLKVGLVYGNRVFNLTANQSILALDALQVVADCDCAEKLVAAQDNFCGCNNYNGAGWGAWAYSPYWYGGQYYAGFYGYGDGIYNGGFKIVGDRIAFDSYVKADSIVLEYQSNGIKGVDTIIPESAISTIVAYIHYMDALFSPNQTTRLQVVPFKQNYQMELKGFVARKFAMTKQDWIFWYRRSFKQTPKR